MADVISFAKAAKKKAKKKAIEAVQSTPNTPAYVAKHAGDFTKDLAKDAVPVSKRALFRQFPMSSEQQLNTMISMERGPSRNLAEVGREVQSFADEAKEVKGMSRSLRKAAEKGKPLNYERLSNPRSIQGWAVEKAREAKTIKPGPIEEAGGLKNMDIKNKWSLFDRKVETRIANQTGKNRIAETNRSNFNKISRGAGRLASKAAKIRKFLMPSVWEIMPVSASYRVRDPFDKSNSLPRNTIGKWDA